MCCVVFISDFSFSRSRKTNINWIFCYEFSSIFQWRTLWNIVEHSFLFYKIPRYSNLFELLLQKNIEWKFLIFWEKIAVFLCIFFGFSPNFWLIFWKTKKFWTHQKCLRKRFLFEKRDIVFQFSREIVFGRTKNQNFDTIFQGKLKIEEKFLKNFFDILGKKCKKFP